MTNYSAGDVVLVKFPFSNLEEEKKRPALVMHQVALSHQERLVTIAMITSKIDGFKIEGDCSIKDWQKTGLLHPSLVRLSKLATVDGQLINKKLGGLTNGDLQTVQKSFNRIFKFWI